MVVFSQRLKTYNAGEMELLNLPWEMLYFC